MWIAEGTWANYSEIKNNATVKYQATSTKLSKYFANHDFTYTCLNPGDHTVLVRYSDGSYETFYITLMHINLCNAYAMPAISFTDFK